MEEKRLVDANHFMQVLKNIEYALKGELTHGKIKTSVVQMIEGSLNAEPTIAPESLQPLTYNENRDYADCDEFICHKCGIHVEDWKQIKIDPDDGEKELCEYTFKHCPECGGNEIQVIDRILNEETREYENRCICWSCGHDWHETEENKEG